MTLHEMQTAIHAAKRQQKDYESLAKDLAKLLIGNLRQVTQSDMYWDHDLLKALKSELTQYNAATRKWKN